MGSINVNDLKPGMVLGSDVFSPNGRFLLGVGTSLDEKHLRTMKIWGVTEADIKGVSRSECSILTIDGAGKELMDRAEIHVQSYFPKALREKEFMCELYRLSLARAARLLLEGQEPARSLPEKMAAVDMEKLSGFFTEHPLNPELLVEHQDKPASFPDIYNQFSEVLRQPNYSTHHLADVISKDVSLTASLLRFVNSAYYSFPSRIDTPERAVTLVGAKELTTLAMGVSVIQAFQDIPSELIDMEDFWKHSIAVGLLCKVIARHVGGLSEERLFVTGLLHDIGRLVMFQQIPKVMGTIILASHARSAPLFGIESMVLGFNHAELGAMLLSEWGLPDSIVEPIGKHHQSEFADDELEAVIIHLSDIMATALVCGLSGNCYVPEPAQGIWDHLGLPISAIETMLQQAERQLSDIVRAFLP